MSRTDYLMAAQGNSEAVNVVAARSCQMPANLRHIRRDSLSADKTKDKRPGFESPLRHSLFRVLHFRSMTQVYNQPRNCEQQSCDTALGQHVP